MTIHFQKNLIKYLIQVTKAKQYFSYLDDSLFDTNDVKILFNLVSSYVKKYQIQPSKTNLLFFLESELNSVEISDEFKQWLSDNLDLYFEPLDPDVKILEETIISFSKRKYTQNLFTNNISKIGDAGDIFFDRVYKNMVEIINIGRSHEMNPSAFLFQDFSLNRERLPKGLPTKYKKMNSMMSAKGFFPPQNNIFLGGPKSFKTGLLLNIALEYVRDGYDVLFVDYENGVDSLILRSVQYYLEATEDEVKNGKYENEWYEIMKRIQKLGGGDIRFIKYRARKDDLSLVELELERLELEENFKPKFIFYDYLDLADAEDKRLSERRLKIQYNYHHAVSINTKFNTISFSVSKAKADAFFKEHLGIEDFAEDSEKPYNAHSAWAINRTKQETELGIARINAIVQRNGISGRNDITCYLKIDEDIMQATEINEKGEKLKDEDIDDN